jgi:hypothetical protein
MNRRTPKMVKGLLIDPITKNVSVVEYNGNTTHCIETLLDNNVEYRIIGEQNPLKTKGQLCLFIQHKQSSMISEKPFSFCDSVFFGSGVIVKLGNYENEYDFCTETLTKKEMNELSECVGFNIKVKYKEIVTKEIEEIEFV